MGLYITCKLCGEQNSTNFTYCKNCDSELPLTEELPSFPDEEPLDVFDCVERKRSKISFNIEKSGFTEETYRISYLDKRDFIIARRSALNRVGLYAFFGITFIVIVFWGLIYVFNDSPDFGEAFVSYLITGIIQILLALSLMVIINMFLDVRRITVYNEDESVIGRIKGNLFFTRWHISESSNENNAAFRFGLFRSIGEMKTSFGTFKLNVTREITLVNDENGEISFSVHSLDSIYVRRRFRIDSSGQLNPLMICLASICIIERMFRPKTEQD
ncbi:MAG: hypothetical protein ACXADY_10705 [Candidatus Hodarchaeales archaeon]